MENIFSADKLISALPYIGHIHVADCPGRHEIGTGETDYKAVFKSLEASQYIEYVGLEYLALDDTKQSLNNLRSYT